MRAWVRIKDDFELKRYVKMDGAFRVLEEFTNWLRSQVKHSDEDKIDLEELYEKWWDFLREEGIDPLED